MLRAELLYEELKGRPDRTAIQERLLLLVSMHRKAVELVKARLLASAARDDLAASAAKDFDTLRNLLMPGTDESDVEREAIRKRLNREADTVLIVRPATDTGEATTVASPVFDTLASTVAVDALRQQLGLKKTRHR